MPISVFTKPINDVGEINVLLDVLDPADSVSRVDHGDLDVITVNFTDVSGNAAQDLEDFYSERGYELLGTTTADIEGRRDWGNFTTANSLIFALLALEGDYGYDTDLSQEVVFDGTIWELNTDAGSTIQLIQDNVVRPGQVGHVETLAFVNQEAADAELTAPLLAIDVAYDETKYFLCENGPFVNQYNMSIPGDTSTGVIQGLTAITSVIDSPATPGVARFQHAGSDPAIGINVRMKNFVTETSYNDNGLVTASGAGFFDVATIAFTATDTGDFSPRNTFVAGFSITGLAISPDGLDMITVQGGGIVRFWTMATAYDFDNAVQGADFDSTNELVNLWTGCDYSFDGRNFYLSDRDGFVFHYTRTGWKEQDFRFTGNSFDFTSTGTTQTLAINTDGRYLYWNNTTTLRQYYLPELFNPSNAILVNTNTGVTNSLSRDIRVSGDGTRVYGGSTDAGDGAMNEYSLGLVVDGILELKGTNANFSIRPTDIDPTGTTSLNAGSLVIRVSGSVSRVFLNTGTSDPNTDGWKTVSMVASTTFEAFVASDLDSLATGGVITIGAGIIFELALRDLMASSVRYVLEEGAGLLFTGIGGIIYTGTGTFITSTGFAALVFQDVQMFSVTGTDKIMDVSSDSLAIVAVLDSTFQGWAGGDIKRSATSVLGPTFTMNISAIRDYTAPLNLVDLDAVLIGTLAISKDTGTGVNVFSLSSAVPGSYSLRGVTGRVPSTDALLDIDAGLDDDARVNLTSATVLGDLFDTAGSTGTFTAVADASILSETINSVSDDGFGNAQFNHSAVEGEVSTNQEIISSGFVTNTSYNGTFKLINAGVGFAVVNTPFIDNADGGIGSYASDSITLTDTATTLVDGDGITIDTDFATDYDGGAIVYNQLTNSIQINRVYDPSGDDPQTGTWATSGLDKSDIRILATNNSSNIASKFIGSAFANNLNTATTGIVNGTFQDIVFGTGGVDLNDSSNSERVKLVDPTNGTFEITGNEPIFGSILYFFYVSSSGGAQVFRVKWLVDKGAGFVDFDDNVEAAGEVGNNIVPISGDPTSLMQKGWLFKPQVTRDAGTSNIIFENVAVKISNGI